MNYVKTTEELDKMTKENYITEFNNVLETLPVHKLRFFFRFMCGVLASDEANND